MLIGLQIDKEEWVKQHYQWYYKTTEVFILDASASEVWATNAHQMHLL